MWVRILQGLPIYMTLQELNDWIKTAKLITTKHAYDHGNDWATKIYEKNGQLYAIEFCNNHPFEQYGTKGWIRGVYAEPKKVKKKIRVIKEEYYE
jgi:hypothetical protein